MAKPKKGIISKRVSLDKTNSTIVIIAAACSFIVVFSLVASKALINRYIYQNHVISASQTTVNKISQDKQAATNLIASYNTFVNQSSNMIGGSSTGTGNQDGPNNKIILDALPDKYDFPALVTSVGNLINGNGVIVNSITGTDQGTGSAAASALTTGTTTIVPVGLTNGLVAMPFSFTVEGPYASMETILDNLQRSIRPIQIQTLSFTGNDSDLTMTVQAQTYYLPPTGLSVTKETVR